MPTESIIFGTKMKIQHASQLKIACVATILTSKSSVKYLGVELDQHMSDECIARKAVSNINNKLRFSYCNTIYFDVKTKKLSMTSLKQCHFDYVSSSLYFGLSKKNKSKFQIM